ncbi:MAG: aldehyde dehydrogenase family protein, partial [Chromatiales bacterium]|nr:aldehyde dehydrogenase family protein [Chromatiales bacterium]
MYNFSEFYIGGEWVEPAQPRSLAVTDPASEQQIGTISLGTAADVDRAVAAARAAFPAFSVSSRDERIDLLDRITDAYKKRYADVAAAISAEMGAPIALATNAQAAMGIAHFKVARNILRKFAFEEELGGTRIVREPVGVCGLITPW